MNDLSFQKSPDKSQISYFLLCNYIGLFIPVAILESDRLFKHAQSLQLAGDKGHAILPGVRGVTPSYEVQGVTPTDANYLMSRFKNQTL